MRGGTRRPPLPSASIRSALLVELTNLGDAITLLYFIRAFRSTLPGVSLQALVDDRFTRLLVQLAPGVEFRGIRRPDRPGGVFRAIVAARQAHVDLALSMGPAYRNAAVVLASRAPYRAGYLRTGGSAAPSLRPNPVEGLGFRAPSGIFYQEEGWLERRWKLFDVLRLRPADDTTGFTLPEELRRESLERLRSAGIINGRPHLVIHPFASWDQRAWPLNSYLSLVERILAECTFDIVVLCARNEQHRLRPFIERFDFTGRVRCFPSEVLLDSAVLLTGAQAMVGNDSGPLHLASAMGIPIIGIYGPSDPRQTAPPHAHSIYHGSECSPCEQRVCPYADHPCLSVIPVDEVMDKVRAVLRQATRPAER
jgi:heptosyltransferase I